MSSIAIVLTLIYLIVEINQNTDALHAQSRQSVLTSSQAELFVLMDNPAIAKTFVQRGELTADEHIQLHLFLTALMRAREFSWLQYNSGTIDEAQWATEVGVIQDVLRPDRTRTWWNTMGRSSFSAEFSSFVDATIQDQPTTDEFWEKMQNWTML